MEQVGTMAEKDIPQKKSRDIYIYTNVAQLEEQLAEQLTERNIRDLKETVYTRSA